MDLKVWLKKNKISSSKFAKLMGVSAPRMSRLVNGQETQAMQLIYRIQEYTGYGVTLKDLCKIED